MKVPSRTADELLEQLTLCLAPKDPSNLERLASLLAAIEPRAYPAVDVALRSHSYNWPVITASKVTPSLFRKVHWAVAAVAASHPNGHVRQAAVRTLAQLRAGRALTQIIVRLNDWVPEVRRAAEAALTQFLAPEYAIDLVDVLPMILAVSRQRRADQSVVTRWALGTFERDDFLVALAAGFSHELRETRLACIEMALKAPSSALRRNAFASALRDPEPYVRSWAARRLEREMAWDWALELATTALRDRSVQVRRLVLPMLLATLPAQEALELCEAALLEEGSSARWQARQLRLKLGPFDFADFYRKQVASAQTNATARGALAGLGESGKKDDTPLVQTFFNNGHLSVRKAALGALAGLHDLRTTSLSLKLWRRPSLVSPARHVVRWSRAFRSYLSKCWKSLPRRIPTGTCAAECPGIGEPWQQVGTLTAPPEGFRCGQSGGGHTRHPLPGGLAR